MGTERQLLVLLVSVILADTKKSWRNKKPHIVIILADDLGWNEVSWHNPHILTPRMEELSRKGVRLERSYVTPKCSPSRAALLTGAYPWRLGMQRGAIERFQATGLNTSIPLLPELLRQGGYTTHMVGKWHLGYCHTSFLPTNRGFDSFFGQYNHVTDYYTRNFPLNLINFPDFTQAHDLHENTKVSHEGEGEFSTDLYTRKAVDVIHKHNSTSNPLFLYLAYQAPHMDIQRPPSQYMSLYPESRVYQQHIKQDGQALYRAAAITALDSGVGRVVDALKDSGMYENSIVIFSTDNGGVIDGSSNFPLRANKETLYEGGVRGVGWVHSPRLVNTGVVSERLMYITDWFSTLLSVSGLQSLLPSNTDSINMWKSLSRGQISPRKEVVHNIDQDTYWGTWSGAITVGRYKLIWGQHRLLKQRLEEESCNIELYNIKKDPEETNNLVKEPGSRRKMLGSLRARLMEVFHSMVSADYPDQTYKEGAVVDGELATGWCQG